MNHLTPIKLCLGGDIMTGRGIDQILPHPSAPQIHEACVHDARTYVQLAERSHGPINYPVQLDYIWGNALHILADNAPHLRLINLETSVTTSSAHWPGKGIHYRMHPKNIGCLTSAHIDCCSLANNHVLDWGYAGLLETLATLKHVGIHTIGAGTNARMAAAPASLDLGTHGHVQIYAWGAPCSGIPSAWAAQADRSGINWLPDFSDDSVAKVCEHITKTKTSNALIVVSMHWGDNWGYEIPDEQRRFSQTLIDHAGVHVIHGHSSHHPKAIEVYHGQPILYGCGDLINDYEGISGYEEFRADLSFLYFMELDVQTKRLIGLRLIPTRMHRFQISSPTQEQSDWLLARYQQQGQLTGTTLKRDKGRTFNLSWSDL